jgi:16S rRNA (guanine(966)-N(2))-methyltransferase RsmD
MRVIAGSQKGRRLAGPSSARLRPTSDRVKEALFSILGDGIVGARFLDLYAGTGAIGIEALSRGAREAAFVESDPASLRVLRTNLDRCGVAASAAIHPYSAARFVRRRSPEAVPYDVVFADPPYDHTDGWSKLLPALAQNAIVRDGSTVILEHHTKLSVPPHIGRLSRLRQYRYGDTTLSVFGLQAAGAHTP